MSNLQTFPTESFEELQKKVYKRVTEPPSVFSSILKIQQGLNNFLPFTAAKEKAEEKKPSELQSQKSTDKTELLPEKKKDKVVSDDADGIDNVATDEIELMTIEAVEGDTKVSYLEHRLKKRVL